MLNTKPFVQVACICENVLEEVGHVMTAVRIVDTYYVPPPPPNLPADVLPVIRVQGLIALKSGDVVGSHRVGLVLENSLGERTTLSPEGGWPAEFAGGEQGVNIRLDFPLGVRNFGLCWFDVLFGDEVLTRIPIRLRPATERPKSPDGDSQG